jgi:hypothetical protein
MNKDYTMEHELITQLKTALADHDWYYSYSDDHSVYCRGRDQANKIHDLRRKCRAAGLADEADSLYEAAQNRKRY